MSASLRSIGPVMLVGAGKMGGAMLEGWLTRGLDPKRISAIDPQPSKRMLTLEKRGVALNPRQRHAHLAGSHQHDGTDAAQRRAHASPTVSNMTWLNASAAVLPAQTTN